MDQSRLEQLLLPISDVCPQGEDLTYSALFDEIREARRADEPALAQGDWETAPKRAEWARVGQLCEEALCRRSKDLQIAAWYAEALARIEGFDGLTIGLRLVTGLLQRYWDIGYPSWNATARMNGGAARLAIDATGGRNPSDSPDRARPRRFTTGIATGSRARLTTWRCGTPAPLSAPPPRKSSRGSSSTAAPRCRDGPGSRPSTSNCAWRRRISLNSGWKSMSASLPKRQTSRR